MPTEGADATADTPACGCKVGRVSRKHELEDMNAELTARWRGDDGDSYSLRELETFFNEEVLRASMREANVEFLQGELENTYRLLVDDDVTAGVRTQTKQRLERDGVPVDEVLGDFVSHQSVHTHLRECLEVDKETKSKDRVQAAEDTVFALMNRTEKITDNHLSRLSGDELVLGDYDIFVEVSVSCNDCGRHYDVGELLERGGCECEQ